MSFALGTQPTTEVDGGHGSPRRHGDTEEWWVTGLRPVTEIDRRPDSQALLGRIVLVSLRFRSVSAARSAAHHSLSISVSSYVLAVSRRRNRRDRLGGRSCKTHRPMLIEAPFNETTGEIIAAAIEVHRALGPGLLESTYSECLQMELAMRRLRYVTQHTLPIVYKGRTLDTSYRVDLIVEDCVVVEVKSVATILPVHRAQVLTYLRLTDVPPGS